MKHLLAILSFLFFAFGVFLGQTSSWKEHYDKAVVATFYSASAMNGHDELEVANLYLDSARMVLSLDSVSNPESMAMIEALHEELIVSKDIAGDNLNYIYPAFSVIKGERDEFNIIDDPGELLIESLVEKAIGVADPVHRGLVKENGHHVLVMVEPFDPVHFTVILDFLSNETPAYGIRRHELEEILGPSGWARFVEGTLDSADHVAIQEHYDVSGMLMLEVLDQGSIIPNPEEPMLFYKGIRLWTINEEGHAALEQYFEGFRVDKGESWMLSIWLVVLNILVAFLFLTLLSGVGYRQDRLTWDHTALFQVESMKRNVIVLMVAGTAVVGIQWLGGTFMPDANAYRGEMGSKLWLLYFVLAPTAGAAALAYLALKRLANGLVDDMTNLSRILYAAFVAHFIYLSFYTYYAELMPSAIGEYVALVPAFFVLSPAFFLGFTAERWMKKARRPWHEKGAFWLVLALSYVAFWLDFQHAFLASYALHGVVFLVALSYLMILPAIVRKPNVDTTEFSQHDWAFPFQTILKGTNISTIHDSIKEFIGPGGVVMDQNPVGFDIEPMLLVLSGESGMGKSRMVKQFLGANGADPEAEHQMDVYYGDFNEQVEGRTEAYEPFVEAFAAKLQLPEGFFSDRSAASRKLGSLLKQGADVLGGGLDMGAAFEMEDDGGQRSVEEMSEELVTKLSMRANPKKGTEGRIQLVIIDHYDWAKDDPQTHDLMKAFIRRLLLQRRLQKLLRVVVVYDGKGEGHESPEVKELLDMAPGRSETHFLEWNGSRENDSGRGRQKFMESLLDRSGFEVSQPGDRIRFDRGIRLHMESVCLKHAPAFNPGDVFAYLHALSEAKALKKVGDRVELVEDHIPEELNLAQGKLDELKRMFKGLEPADQKLLGMAANVGFKFDATILASICGRDLLGVLEQLAELEGQFVRDQADEDNIYAFANRELHRAIVKESSRGRKDNEFMQVLVEYHKRTVGSMMALGDGYVQRLDLEILASTADSALKPSYLSVEMIRDTAPFVVLHASLAALRIGRVRKVEEWMTKMVEANLPWWDGGGEDRTSEPRLMASVLAGANDGPGLRGFDRPLGSDRRVLGEILKACGHLGDSGIRESILLALYRDLYTHGAARDAKDQKRLSKEEWDQRKVLIEESWSGLSNPSQTYRFTFYSLLMEGGGELIAKLEGLLDEVRRVHADESLPLEGEILRHLALKVSGTDLKRKHAYAVEALQFEARRIGVDNTAALDPNPSWDEVMELVNAMLTVDRPTSDFNFTLSRLRDVAYEEKEYDLVIELSRKAEEMSKVLSDKQGMILAKSFHGAALFRKKEFEASLAVYRGYSEFLMEEGRPKEDFRWPLEGILRNVESLGCPEVFLDEMKGLYSHLKFISQEMKEEAFWSPISDDRLLGDLIPGTINAEPMVRTEAGEEQREKARAILEVLSCIAMADGEFEEHEYHDLEESATALAVCLNLPDQLIREESKTVANRIKSMGGDLRMKTFEAALDKVASGADGRKFQRAVVQLCWDMAYSDGVLEPEERVYLDKAKAQLKS